MHFDPNFPVDVNVKGNLNIFNYKIKYLIVDILIIKETQVDTLIMQLENIFKSAQSKLRRN